MGPFPRPGRAVRLMPLLLALSLLQACGDNHQSTAAAGTRLLADRVVAVTEAPTLYRCLDALGATLRQAPGRAQASLACAAGTYRGQTSTGRPCSLQVDSEHGTFHFQLDGESVRIQLEAASFGADGAPRHNLEDASAPGQPGIQLTRFSAAPEALTEALILRFERTLPALPQMIYQRVADGPPHAVVCRFGK